MSENFKYFKQGKIIVVCDTKDEVIEFLKTCKRDGDRWWNGSTIIPDKDFEQCNGAVLFGMFEPNRLCYTGHHKNKRVIKYEDLLG